MKTNLSIFLFFMWVVAGAQQPTCIFDCSFEGTVSGTLYVAIYDSESDWGKREKIHLGKTYAINQLSNFICSFSDLKPGSYAVAFFLDENGNGKLDTNWMGIPIEAYGYSNGSRPKYRAADWSEVRFALGQGNTLKQQVDVKKWKF